VSFAKQKDDESEAQFYIGIFQCPSCRTRFRSRLDTNPSLDRTKNVKNIVERINDVRVGLTQTLKSLNQKIRTLETERSSLLLDIEELRKVAESRAASLENEVNELREELRSLKELLKSPIETR
jgi:chromosome segregation ATPase